ncbi:MAG: hypothetical protein GWQ05_03245, partial [Verrucomicrobiaceae bacterium]|nr:hypothetical protein [Verrucomicrobiaceae bacterium]
MPEWLSYYFGLDPVLAKDLGVTNIEGKSVDPDTKLFPLLKVVPMGWKWALFIVQRVHEHVLEQDPAFEESRRACDFRPPPSVHERAFYSLYVDNVLVEGHDAEEVGRMGKRATELLENAGYATHDFSEACPTMSTLGVEQDGLRQTVHLSSTRYWRLWWSIEVLLKNRKPITSTQMERLLGHFTFIALLRRELLSTLRACYDFVSSKFLEPRVVWFSVERELKMVQGLLIFARRHLGSAWDPRVSAFDACESGHATVESTADVDDIRQIGRWHERWRYKSGDKVDDPLIYQPRQRAFMNMNEETNKIPDTSDPDQNPMFPEVPNGFVSKLSWKTTNFQPIFTPEAIHLSEMRGYLGSIRRRLLGDPAAWHKNHLILGDNLGLMLSLSKGRCRNPTLLMLHRRAAAWMFATGSRFLGRWLPSEINPADEPSRRREAARGHSPGWRPTPPGASGTSSTEGPSDGESDSEPCSTTGPGCSSGSREATVACSCQEDRQAQTEPGEGGLEGDPGRNGHGVWPDARPPDLG